VIPPIALSVPNFISFPGFAGYQVGHGVMIPLRSGDFHLTYFEPLPENEQHLFHRGQVTDRKIEHDESPGLVVNRDPSGQSTVRGDDQRVPSLGIIGGWRTFRRRPTG